MSGQAVITINGSQWNAWVANTTTELTTGLRQVLSMPNGVGMLFILPSKQVVSVDTTGMNFPIDIIFIKDDVVLDIARDIQPEYLVTEETPCDMFLEVNSGDASLVEVGDIVSTVTIKGPSSNWSTIISFAVPLMFLGFVGGAMGGMFKSLGGGSSKKQIGSGNPGNPNGYYWEICDIETGEIMRKGREYSTGVKALSAARSFQRGRSGKDVEHSVMIRVFDNPRMNEWGKTIKPVMESGMHHGIPIEIGKTPLQRAALDRLWPYGILEIHSDGDLTVFSQGKKWVVTTEGGVFKEEDIIHLGNKMIEVPIGKGYQEGIPVDTKVDIGYGEWVYAKVGSTEMRGRKSPVGIDIEQVSDTYDLDELQKAVDEIERKIKGVHSIHGEPRRKLVEKWGSWAVGRAEAVCPEDDIACVAREAERLVGTIRVRHGEEAMEYVTIISPGGTVFHISDTVSMVALEKENKRVRGLGLNEATYQVAKPKVVPIRREVRKETSPEIEYLPDSSEFLTYTIQDIGYADKLEGAFRDRILKVRSS